MTTSPSWSAGWESLLSLPPSYKHTHKPTCAMSDRPLVGALGGMAGAVMGVVGALWNHDLYYLQQVPETPAETIGNHLQSAVPAAKPEAQQ
eukprot:1161210-Pelagomonas_calceolata.AAC.11